MSLQRVTFEGAEYQEDTTFKLTQYTFVQTKFIAPGVGHWEIYRHAFPLYLYQGLLLELHVIHIHCNTTITQLMLEIGFAFCTNMKHTSTYQRC